MEEASFLCDRIVIMDNGKILAQGTLEELLTLNHSDEIIEFSFNGDPETLNLEISQWFRKLNWDPDRKKVTLFVTEILRALPDIIDMTGSGKHKITNLECRKMTLDDLFISLTGRRLTD